jgi:DNA-binding IclR family transcriptional regulator
VAAAIPEPGAAATMSVSVSVPSEHIDAARVRRIAAAVRAAADRVATRADGR